MTSTTTTRPTIAGRAAAERLLGVIDQKSLSVADAAVTAGLPVAEVEGLLHLRPSRLSAETAARLAAALRVTLPAGPACPAWCTSRHHDREAADPLLSCYFHDRTVADVGALFTVRVVSFEDFVPDATPAPVVVSLDTKPSLTPAEARALAAALVEAAALAEG